MEDRELRVKKLFEETITIPIEKYDELQQKAGKLEYILFYEKKKKVLEAIAEQNMAEQNEVFETEVIDE